VFRFYLLFFFLVLEMEYDNIDRSKEVLQQFKEKFQLPDMNSLSKFLQRVKWTSIINETQTSIS